MKLIHSPIMTASAKKCETLLSACLITALIAIGLLSNLSAQLTDTDLDRIPDFWETQYGLNPLFENLTVGSSSDGNLTISNGTSVSANPVSIPIINRLAAGVSEIVAAIPTGVNAGDVLLLHVSQAGSALVGSPVGTWEIVTVATKVPERITLLQPLRNTFDPATGTVIQCVRIPQYDQLTIDGTLTADPWDGGKGGILAVAANDVYVSSTGSISADWKGFRGGAEASSVTFPSGVNGLQGESVQKSSWPTARSTSKNGTGGGGGGFSTYNYSPHIGCGGGGGANAIQGNNGNQYSFGSSGAGEGGNSAIAPLSPLLIFGSGGGAGGVNSGSENVGRQGGNGGGIIMIVSRTLHLSGTISSSGASGGQTGVPIYMNNGNWVYGSPGGGGAGGSMLIASRIIGTGNMTANKGKSGEPSNTSGDGSPGRIRIERNSLPATGVSPFPFALSSSGSIPSELSSLVKYVDHDGDGLSDLAEFQAGTSPILADTDGDGLPDAWEVKFGTLPTIADAMADPDHDGLTNLQEYLAGSNPNSIDSDGDGIPDISEISIYGTNPLMADTDGDGMDDAWEIANGLNPLVNDAALDPDMDGLTNKEEYDHRAEGYRPNAWNSKAGTPGDDHLSDYRRLKGQGWTRRTYDKLNRLISTERDNGSVELYVYDGNGNKVRDVILTSIDGGGGMPAAWKFAQGLAYTGAGATNGDNGPTGDPDHDGFSNYQEWLAGTDPMDASSRPSSGAAIIAPSIAAAAGFTPTKWVMATGQIDAFGSDAVVISADGIPGTSSNGLTILRRGNTNTWQSSGVDVGKCGVSSIMIAEPASGQGSSLFISAQPATGFPTIEKYGSTGAAWQKNVSPVASSMGPGVAQVVGMFDSDLFCVLSPDSSTTNALCRLSLQPDGKLAAPTTYSSASGNRGSATPVFPGAMRWLDGGGIEICGQPRVARSLTTYRRLTTREWYLQTPYALSWTAAEQFATQNGGHLSILNDATEDKWVRDTFPGVQVWLGISCYVSLNGFFGSRSDWSWVTGSFSPYCSPFIESISWSSIGIGAGNCGVYIDGSGGWNLAYETQPRKGLVEIPESSFASVLAEPQSASKLLWRGRSLAAGQLRATGCGTPSIAYAYIEDVDTSGTVGAGDNFVVGEYDLSGSSNVLRTNTKIPLTSNQSSPAYGLALLARKDTTGNNVLGVGEPDGTVSLWFAPDSTSPLQRVVLTTGFVGKSWHQFERLREANGREGLAGLLVDPATPTQCQVIYWSPDVIESALAGTMPILNNLPWARILPSPAGGGAYSTVGLRIWDAESHATSLELQYQRSGDANWSNATVISADGVTFQSTLQVTSQPGGVSHSLIWNAAANLGNTFSGTVLLRTRATDSQTGDWSPAMPYAVNTDTTTDSDGDGMPDSWETAHSLIPSDPTDGASDTDHDGVSAFLEYALAMNPNVPDVQLLPRLGTRTEADGEHLTLNYQRPVNSGLTYTAERSVTLTPGSWQSGTSVFQELPPVDQGDGSETVTVEDLNPISAFSRAWLRLRVSK